MSESYMDWLVSMGLVDKDQVTENSLPIMIVLEDEYTLYKDWPDWGYSKEAIERKLEKKIGGNMDKKNLLGQGAKSFSGSGPYCPRSF